MILACLTSTRGELEVLQEHHYYWSKMSVDSVFDAGCKEKAEDSVSSGYGSLSEKLQMPF